MYLCSCTFCVGNPPFHSETPLFFNKLRLFVPPPSPSFFPDFSQQHTPPQFMNATYTKATTNDQRSPLASTTVAASQLRRLQLRPHVLPVSSPSGGRLIYQQLGSTEMASLHKPNIESYYMLYARMQHSPWGKCRPFLALYPSHRYRTPNTYTGTVVAP